MTLTSDKQQNLALPRIEPTAEILSHYSYSQNIITLHFYEGQEYCSTLAIVILMKQERYEKLLLVKYVAVFIDPYA